MREIDRVDDQFPRPVAHRIYWFGTFQFGDLGRFGHALSPQGFYQAATLQSFGRGNVQQLIDGGSQIYHGYGLGHSRVCQTGHANDQGNAQYLFVQGAPVHRPSMLLKLFSMVSNKQY